MHLFLILLNILQKGSEISCGSGMVYFLKVAALSLPLLALKSSAVTATRYYSSALLPTSAPGIAETELTKSSRVKIWSVLKLRLCKTRARISVNQRIRAQATSGQQRYPGDAYATIAVHTVIQTVVSCCSQVILITWRFCNIQIGKNTTQVYVDQAQRFAMHIKPEPDHRARPD